jgi:hypothetical protein
MKHYTDEADARNSAVVYAAQKTASRLALRLNRELGISIHHAMAAVEANGAGKEKYDD